MMVLGDGGFERGLGHGSGALTNGISMLIKETPASQVLSGKESACQHRRRSFHSWVGKIPWSRKRQPTAVFLPGESHGQRRLVGYSLWGHRVRHNLLTEKQQQKRDPRVLPQPFCLPYEDRVRRQLSMNQEAGPHQTSNLLIPWFWIS